MPKTIDENGVQIEATCDNCIFYVNGHCCRYPPVFYNYTDRDNCMCVTTGFPDISDDTYWCGEYKSKYL